MPWKCASVLTICDQRWSSVARALERRLDRAPCACHYLVVSQHSSQFFKQADCRARLHPLLLPSVSIECCSRQPYRGSAGRHRQLRFSFSSLIQGFPTAATASSSTIVLTLASNCRARGFHCSTCATLQFPRLALGLSRVSSGYAPSRSINIRPQIKKDSFAEDAAPREWHAKRARRHCIPLQSACGFKWL